MRGKTVIITGASSGIGLASARELARMGARLVMICRDAERGHRARRAVEQVAAWAAPELLLADISSQASVRVLAGQIRERCAEIDVLINNAAGIFTRRELTADGVEKTFATNHLGPFLLTNLLLDLLRPGGRIINVVAEAYPGKLAFDNLQGERSYGFLSAYFRSKLCNIIFTFDLARRLDATGVTVNCVSPGPSRTRFGDDLTGLPRLFPLLAKPLFPSAEKGARGVLHLAEAAEVEGLTGRFFLRQRARQTKPVTRDPIVAARLWRMSADLVGLSPEKSRNEPRAVLQPAI